MNQFPNDFPHALSGFGGNPQLTRAQHRERRRKCPVILVHGNASHCADPKYGMLAMRGFLKDAGYEDVELWAPDYLGENNTRVVLQGVHRDHIDAFRAFVDAVRAYLDVERVDFITHSLGCGMVNAYLRGLQSNGLWDHEDHRFDGAGTFVSIAGAQYGLGPHSIDEFRTGSRFEVMSHRFGEVSSDDTPFGCGDPARQCAPRQDWIVTSALDDNQVCYVAIIAREDFVDQQHPDTSRRNGADLNKVFNVGQGAAGHERIVKDQAVFDAFQGYLNRYPPVPPVRFSVDKDSGNYGPRLQLRLTVAPPDAAVAYTARRLTREVQAGFLTESVAEVLEGYLADGQSLGLEHDGAWDLRFTAASGQPLERTYGVNVSIPELAILTANDTPFQGSLEIKTTASKGKVYYSEDKTRWLAESNPTIHDTATLHFIAIDAEGLPSPMLSRTWEKKPLEFVKATLTEHFIAGRLETGDYIDLTLQLGPNAVVILYLVNGEWVRDPDTTEVALAPPSLSISEPGGVKTGPLTLALAAHHATDAAPAIHYTLDGSLPTRHSPSFTSSGRLRIGQAGTTTLTCRSRDAAGHWSEPVRETYRMEPGPGAPGIACDRPSGVYAGGFDALVSAPAGSGPDAVVYYTEDGSDPSDAKNPNRKSFEGSKRFSIRGNGPHALLCYARDAEGQEAFQSFGWRIDDHDYPETRISPAAGGSYAGRVRIALGVDQPCAWTRYTLDGSEPSASNGELYTGPILLDHSARLRFRSLSLAGKLEPARSATFLVTPQPGRLEFESDERLSGYLAAEPGRGEVLVGTASLIRVGAAPESAHAGDCRAILHFDTSSLPDNVSIQQAYLELPIHAERGGRPVEVDVQRGHFGSSHALRAGDWDARATAQGAARIEACAAGPCRSTDFSEAGREAIDRTGVTQVRLRMAQAAGDAGGACLMLDGGQRPRLVVTLASLDN